jgi:plasmid stabilization system protein ParE
VRVLVAPEAAAQAEAIARWWRVHRPAAPELFGAEFEAALSALGHAPRLGPKVEHPSVSGLRRIRLRATRFHLYYRIDGEELQVVAVWSALRGRGPELSRLG